MLRGAANLPPLVSFCFKNRAGRHRFGFSLHPRSRSSSGPRSPAARQDDVPPSCTFPLCCLRRSEDSGPFRDFIASNDPFRRSMRRYDQQTAHPHRSGLNRQPAKDGADRWTYCASIMVPKCLRKLRSNRVLFPSIRSNAADQV